MKGTLRLTIISVLFVLIINFFNIEIYANTTNQTKTNSNNSNTKTHSNGIYKIAIGKLPSKTFEVAGSSKENNAKVDIWNYGNVPAQKFYFEYQNGFYKIMVMHTGKSLTVKNNSIQEGTEIVQADYSGSNGQKWLLKDTKKNGWTISPLNNPDFALTVQNNIQNGSKIILSKTKNNDNQMLYIFNINKEEAYQKDGIYKISVGKKPSKTLEVAGSSKENNAKVDIWNYGNVPAQKFYFEYKEGYYKITAMHTGKNLTVKGKNIKDGTEIVQDNYTGDHSQRWILRDTHKNGWIISPLSNPNLAITIQGNIQNGSKIVLANVKDNDNQMLYLYNITNNERTHKDDTYKLAIGKDSNKTIEVAGSSKDNNAKIDIWNYGNAEAQKYKFEYINGYYKITAKHTGKSLTAKNNVLQEGTEIVQADYTGNNSQKWLLRDTHKNGWIISPISNPNLAITVQGSIQNGSKIILSKTQDNDNQMLYIMEPINKGIKEGLYGKSGLMYKGTGGSYLKYYKIGTGTKHLILNYSIHGFEDSYSKDGSELTYMANELYNYLKSNMSDDLIQKWTVYILPLSNPDGQYSGWTNDGPGRTTVYSWANGHKGIDMNRCFPVGYTSLRSERNYNGTAPLQAYEAQSLRDFILNNTGTQNIVIDVHGWLNETVGNNEIGSLYRNEFGISKHINTYGKGYLIQWARTIPKTKSMLLELPEVKSHNELVSKKYVDKFNKATINLLKKY